MGIAFKTWPPNFSHGGDPLCENYASRESFQSAGCRSTKSKPCGHIFLGTVVVKYFVAGCPTMVGLLRRSRFWRKAHDRVFDKIAHRRPATIGWKKTSTTLLMRCSLRFLKRHVLVASKRLVPINALVLMPISRTVGYSDSLSQRLWGSSARQPPGRRPHYLLDYISVGGDALLQ